MLTNRFVHRGPRRDSAPIALRPVESEALAFLLPLSPDYPNIERWYRTKVVPGVRTGSRTLLRIERGGQLVGLGIGKIEPEERKICTVRVAPSYIGSGMGMRIFDGLLKWLDVDRPHLTISEAKLPAFERIFDYFGFAITSVRKGLYVPNACELAYNESAQTVSDPLSMSRIQAAIQHGHDILEVKSLRHERRLER